MSYRFISSCCRVHRKSEFKNDNELWIAQLNQNLQNQDVIEGPICTLIKYHKAYKVRIWGSILFCITIFSVNSDFCLMRGCIRLTFFTTIISFQQACHLIWWNLDSFKFTKQRSLIRCLFAKKYFIFILKLYHFVILGSLQYLLEKTTLEQSHCQGSDKIRTFCNFRQICESEWNCYRKVRKLLFCKLSYFEFWKKEPYFVWSWHTDQI